MSSDPLLNCILEVCCGRAAADQQFAKAMVRDGVCSEEYAAKVVEWVRHRFDLAPVNTLGPLKNRIIDLAKGSPFREGDE